MSGVVVPTLYVMSGVCAFAALHHGLAVLRRRVYRVHLLFALLCLALMAFILAKASSYQAHTPGELVASRRWEIAFVSLFFALFAWFIAEYSNVRFRKVLAALTVFWAVLFAVNLSLPYGVQFVELPHLTYLKLPWGETVLDLHVRQRSVWHNLGWAAIFVTMAYGLYAAVELRRAKQRQKARALSWALGLFFGALVVNFAVNRELITFVQTAEFGFLAVVVMMDLEMMLESRDSRRRLREVLDHLPAAICLKDTKGRFQLINRGFETAFHANEARMLGKTDLDLFPRELAERFRADEKRALDTGQEVEDEHALEWKGTQRIYRSYQAPLLRPDGSPYAVCSAYVDVTDARQRDELLNKFRRQVWHADRVASTGAIAGSLAHEICQPLAAILNNAQAGLRFMAQDKVDLEEIREILEDIVRDDKRAGTVINGLRAMLQQQEMPHADIDLGQCLEEVLELLHSEFVRQGIETQRELEAGLKVRANKTQIQQVSLNLMINALEAMAEQPAGKRILTVRLTREDGKARVSIRDTGIGIAEDMLYRIFEGFYTTKPHGLGVGLEVCRSIVESHRGSIWAESNPDQGATFHFTLPLVQDASAMEDPASV